MAVLLRNLILSPFLGPFAQKVPERQLCNFFYSNVVLDDPVSSWKNQKY